MEQVVAPVFGAHVNGGDFHATATAAASGGKSMDAATSAAAIRVRRPPARPKTTAAKSKIKTPVALTVNTTAIVVLGSPASDTSPPMAPTPNGSVTGARGKTPSGSQSSAQSASGTGTPVVWTPTPLPPLPPQAANTIQYNFNRLHPDDARDKVFVAIIKALIRLGNRPSSPKELASAIMKFHFAVLGGSTPYATVSSRISQHFKRIAEAYPPRPPVLGKHTDERHSRKIHYYLNGVNCPAFSPIYSPTSSGYTSKSSTPSMAMANSQLPVGAFMDLDDASPVPDAFGVLSSSYQQLDDSRKRIRNRPQPPRPSDQKRPRGPSVSVEASSAVNGRLYALTHAQRSSAFYLSDDDVDQHSAAFRDRDPVARNSQPRRRRSLSQFTFDDEDAMQALSSSAHTILRRTSSTSSTMAQYGKQKRPPRKGGKRGERMMPADSAYGDILVYRQHQCGDFDDFDDDDDDEDIAAKAYDPNEMALLSRAKSSRRPGSRRKNGIVRADWPISSSTRDPAGFRSRHETPSDYDDMDNELFDQTRLRSMMDLSDDDEYYDDDDDAEISDYADEMMNGTLEVDDLPESDPGAVAASGNGDPATSGCVGVSYSCAKAINVPASPNNTVLTMMDIDVLDVMGGCPPRADITTSVTLGPPSGKPLVSQQRSSLSILGTQGSPSFSSFIDALSRAEVECRGSPEISLFGADISSMSHNTLLSTTVDGALPALIPPPPSPTTLDTAELPFTDLRDPESMSAAELDRLFGSSLSSSLKSRSSERAPHIVDPSVKSEQTPVPMEQTQAVTSAPETVMCELLPAKELSPTPASDELTAAPVSEKQTTVTTVLVAEERAQPAPAVAPPPRLPTQLPAPTICPTNQAHSARPTLSTTRPTNAPALRPLRPLAIAPRPSGPTHGYSSSSSASSSTSSLVAVPAPTRRSLQASDRDVRIGQLGKPPAKGVVLSATAGTTPLARSSIAGMRLPAPLARPRPQLNQDLTRGLTHANLMAAAKKGHLKKLPELSALTRPLSIKRLAARISSGASSSTGSSTDEKSASTGTQERDSGDKHGKVTAKITAPDGTLMIPTFKPTTPAVFLSMLEGAPVFLTTLGAGQGLAREFCLMRRVDNGYVNGSSLLEAGGIDKESERSIILSLEVGRVRVPQRESRMCGTWIPLVRARALAATCSLQHRLGPFLNDNLASYFPSPLPLDSSIALPACSNASGSTSPSDGTASSSAISQTLTQSISRRLALLGIKQNSGDTLSSTTSALDVPPSMTAPMDTVMKDAEPKTPTATGERTAASGPGGLDSVSEMTLAAAVVAATSGQPIVPAPAVNDGPATWRPHRAHSSDGPTWLPWTRPSAPQLSLNAVRRPPLKYQGQSPMLGGGDLYHHHQQQQQQAAQRQAATAGSGVNSESIKAAIVSSSASQPGIRPLAGFSAVQRTTSSTGEDIAPTGPSVAIQRIRLTAGTASPATSPTKRSRARKDERDVAPQSRNVSNTKPNKQTAAAAAPTVLPITASVNDARHIQVTLDKSGDMEMDDEELDVGGEDEDDDLR